MPKNEQNRIDIPQSTIELTGCKIADIIEHIQENDKAVLVRSIAFEHTAPNGEKLQVQIMVTRDEELMLLEGIDKFEYEVG